MKITFISLSAIAIVLLAAAPLHAACGTTTFTPNRWATNGYEYPTNPSTHNAIYLTDPDNKQYALFDLEWSGGLVALRYKPSGGVLLANGTSDPAATELIWGHDPGAMAQFAAWTGNSKYNPNQAGDIGVVDIGTDFGRGPPIYGFACKGNLLIVHTSIPEFNQNDAPWGNNINYARAAMISGGAPRYDMWYTPYAATFIASWAPSNVVGAPAYYLKLDYYIHHTDVREEFTHLDMAFALYSPGNFVYPAFQPDCRVNPCPAPTSGEIAANQQPFRLGHYPNANLTGGVAISMNALTQLPGLVRYQTGQTPDYFWDNVTGQLTGQSWALSPGTGRRFIVYVQAGDWSAANAFLPQ